MRVNIDVWANQFETKEDVRGCFTSVDVGGAPEVEADAQELVMAVAALAKHAARWSTDSAFREFILQSDGAKDVVAGLPSEKGPTPT